MRTVMQMKWLTIAFETYGSLSKTTKNLLVFCASYMLAIGFCAAACRICAGWLIGYYTGLQLSADLFAAIRPCVGVAALGVLLTESALRSSS